MIQLARIVVPTDFSDHSVKALRYGVELAARFGASLHLFHTLEVPILYDEVNYYPPESVVDLEGAAEKELENVDVGSAEIEIVRKVTRGDPFVEIIRYAKSVDADLIVLGTHGRGAIAHMLLGNVAEMVVRKAHCPVLVVRDEQHDFIMP